MTNLFVISIIIYLHLNLITCIMYNTCFRYTALNAWPKEGRTKTSSRIPWREASRRMSSEIFILSCLRKRINQLEWIRLKNIPKYLMPCSVRPSLFFLNLVYTTNKYFIWFPVAIHSYARLHDLARSKKSFGDCLKSAFTQVQAELQLQAHG